MIRFLLSRVSRLHGWLTRYARRVALKAAGRRPPVRVVLGGGHIPVPGWIVTDADLLNILDEKDWRRYFRSDSIDSCLAEHVWEHLTRNEGERAARLCYRFLRPGGRLRIAVPDGRHPDSEYLDAVKPMGSGEGAHDHKVLYTSDTLEDVLRSAGFSTRVLEGFDANGAFMTSLWDPEDGMIHRSARFDPRNRDGSLRYTSIIIDAIKPDS